MEWDLEGWQQAKRILCIRLDSMGDVLMTTPALRAIKKSGSRRSITLMTSKAGTEVAQYIPEVDDVITYSAPWLKASSLRVNSRLETQMIENLRRRRYDAAVIFTVYSQNPLPTAFMCYLADIPLRLAHCRENPYQLLTHWVKDPEPEGIIRHETRRQLDLVATVGSVTTSENISFAIPSEARVSICKKLDKAGLDPSRPWLVIHPGASAPSRRYPWQYYARLGRMLVDRAGFQVVFTGTPAENDLIRTIQVKMNRAFIPLPLDLTLGEFGALLEIAPLLISNNTGPVHLAAAFRTPVVDLYALTNPQHQPWLTPNRVLSYDVPCRFCYKSVCPEGHHNCLRLINPEAVYQAVMELLDEVQSGADKSYPLKLEEFNVHIGD